MDDKFLDIYKILLWKAYFDKGWSLTNYFKYVIFMAGIFDVVEIDQAMWMIAIYIVCCFVIGWVWYNYGFIDTENEVNNDYNPFQRQVRKSLNIKTR